MGLDVETPEPPDLTNRGLPTDIEPDEVVDGESDLRRGELEGILRDGAWHEAFLEWAEYTDLSEMEYRTVHDAGLFDEMDFYWDPVERRIGFEPPDVPSNLGDRQRLSSLATTELSDLGDMVIDMLEDGYLDWGEGASATEEWRGEPYDGEDTQEE